MALTDALMFDYDAATVAPPVVDTGTQLASGRAPVVVPGVVEPEPVPTDSVAGEAEGPAAGASQPASLP